jgi:hypothetical protein
MSFNSLPYLAPYHGRFVQVHLKRYLVFIVDKDRIFCEKMNSYTL